MFRIAQVVLLLLFTCRALACEDPNGADFQKPVVGYARAHQVHHAYEGTRMANDSLLLWDRTEKAMCFHFQTIHTNAHLCWLTGSAKKVAPREYEYRDAQCKVRFQVLNGAIRVRVNDPSQPKRHFCNPSDTEQYVCGTNTGIAPGIFRAVKDKYG